MVEFELVKQALYIDPNDQSGWLYHRWLVGCGDDPAVLEREICVITEILELEADSKCVSLLSRPSGFISFQSLNSSLIFMIY